MDKKKQFEHEMPGLDFAIKPPHHYVALPNLDQRFTYPDQIIRSMQGGKRTEILRTFQSLCVDNVIYKYYYNGQQNPFGPNRLTRIGMW